MLGRISSISFLFLLSLSVHAEGKSEMEVREDLEKQGVSSITIRNERGAVTDYVFISEDIVYISSGSSLAELNLSTMEWKGVETPTVWKERNVHLLNHLSYDPIMNTIHMVIQENIQGQSRSTLWTYCLLYLDDYSWEEIHELGDDVYEYGYDPVGKLIYYTKILDRRLFIFNIRERREIDRIDVVEGIAHILRIYGDPSQTLAMVRDKEDAAKFYYYIYFNEERFGIEFPHINYESLDDYVYIGQNIFLCIRHIRQRISEIVEFDFINNTLSVVALRQFPHFIWRLKKTPDGRYSFLITADNDRMTLLCFLKYP